MAFHSESLHSAEAMIVCEDTSKVDFAAEVEDEVDTHTDKTV
jgi:hypothetical protein